MKKSFFLLLIICLILSINTFAQNRNLQIVNPKRESPRATIKTFLEAFKLPRVGVSPDPVEEAINCLDLQEMPPDYRQLKGLELSAQLLEIIDVVENFHVEDVPNNISGEPYLVFRSQEGEIVIAKQPTGEWLFTQETVRSIPLLLVTVEEERRNFGSATLTHSDSFGTQIRDKMPDVLKQRILSLERWQWLGLLLLLLLGAVAAQIVKTVISWTFGKALLKRYRTLTEENLKTLYPPIGLLTFVLTFRLGLNVLALTQSFLGYLRTTIFLLNALAVVWLAYRSVHIIAQRFQAKAIAESHTNVLLVPFVSILVRILIVIIGLIVVAENLNFNVAGLIAGLGIGGIAIALASQETLSNFFASLVLLIERPFIADDKISVGGVEGTVKQVGLRSTIIQKIDNSLITIPNSTVVKANIVNDGIQRYRNWILNLNVSCQNGAEKIKEFSNGIEEIIKRSKFLHHQIYKLHIYDLVYPSLILRVEINFVNADFDFELEARQEFITEILQLADDLEIKMEVAKK